MQMHEHHLTSALWSSCILMADALFLCVSQDIKVLLLDILLTAKKWAFEYASHLDDHDLTTHKD